MIYFATTRRNERPIRKYLAGFGAPLARRLKPVRYEWLLRARRLPHGTWCFADLELLSQPERERATQVWQELSARGCRLLNHPTRSLRRYELLRLLHAGGSNRFGVHHLGDDTAASYRYPLFLRGENDHAGSRTPLLHDAAELKRELLRLHRAGEHLSELLVTEFCDTADKDGVYRKYSAFVVGDAILARHLFFRRDWQVKRNELQGEGYADEERRYVATNPHEARLREIFAAAGIQYGRIDYAVLEGELQVWEINTNPVIVFPGREARGLSWASLRARLFARRAPPQRSGPRARLHAEFAARLLPVWQALDAP